MPQEGEEKAIDKHQNKWILQSNILIPQGKIWQTPCVWNGELEGEISEV